MGGSGGGMGGSGGSGSTCAIDCSMIATGDCQKAICNEGTGMCEIVPDTDGIPCDDGVFCTANDACQAGTCVGPDVNTCGNTVGACDDLVCDEQSQTCSVTPLVDGTACTPSDLCQSNGSCLFGQCQGTPKDCFFFPVPNECHIATCNPMDGMCQAVPGNEGLGCIDQNDLCSDFNVCTMGTCGGGGPKDCSTLSVGCNNGVCDPANGQCYQVPVMPGQNCLDATDDCNQGICDMNGVCVANPINNGMMCDDGLSCTTGTTCTNGTCGGGMSNITIYFSEDFSSNSAGWTLGTEWQIGSATISTGGTGNGDPGQDHSTSADNGVAGVVIGGNAATNLHPYYYLTSPPVNTAAATTVWLEYWRWLNSDYTPFMQNSVEVFNGTSWIPVWQSASSAIFDAAWVNQQFDISVHKNANMQVRFGFTIGSSGVYTVGQWNLDDVVIASGTCN
jgi:hypothetical protein